jgi:hypothetical protein
MNKDRIVVGMTVVFVVMMALWGMTIIDMQPKYRTIVSEKGCCCIIIDENLQVVNTATVTWVNNLELDDRYTVYVEVEYPDSDMTEKESFEYELEWAIDEAMDTCYTTHGSE